MKITEPLLLVGLVVGAASGCADEAVPATVSGVSASIDDAVATILRVRWTQDLDADAWLEFEPGDGRWRASPAVALAAGENEALILGAPPETEVLFRVVTDNRGAGSASDDHAATTGALPEDLPPPTPGVWDEGAASPEGYILGSVDADGGSSYSGPFWLFIADRAGRVVWYHEVGPYVTMFPRVAKTGDHIIYDIHSVIDPTGTLSRLWRMTLDGAYTEEIEALGLGWTWDETDDGALLFDRIHGVEHATIEEIAPDGSQRTVWDCTVWQLPLDDDPEHCYTNTVNWVAATDSILWSTYWGDYVVEVSRATGEVIWYAGSLPGGFSIDPESSGFDLQHYPNYTPDGTLLVSTHVPGADGEQRAREFEVDHAAQTLREIWSWGEGVDDYWAQYSGEAARLPGGNTLINEGTGGGILEVDPEGRVVWSLDWGEGSTLGHSQLIEDLYALNRGPGM